MSIYATLWRLKFPAYGDDHSHCEWVEVIAQSVPGHIGTPAPGFGYEDGDPYASFLPPAVEDEESLRAVVFVRAGTPKGTQRSPQEYVHTLLILSGDQYTSMPFAELHQQICAALRGVHPRVVAESWEPDGTVRLIFEDGSIQEIPKEDSPSRLPS
jgi:hypothetical protein